VAAPEEFPRGAREEEEKRDSPRSGGTRARGGGV